MKKLLIALIAFAACYANNWVIKSITPNYLITMENGTRWQFEEDPGTRYYNWDRKEFIHRPGRDKRNILNYTPGDSLILKRGANDQLIFASRCGCFPIGCSLHSYSKNLPVISSIEKDGYAIELSDGNHLHFSWCQSWSSYKWRKGDPVLVLPGRRSSIALNLKRLHAKSTHYCARIN